MRTGRWLRRMTDGKIFTWNEELSEKLEMYEVSDEDAHAAASDPKSLVPAEFKADLEKKKAEAVVEDEQPNPNTPLDTEEESSAEDSMPDPKPVIPATKSLNKLNKRELRDYIRAAGQPVPRSATRNDLYIRAQKIKRSNAE